jgi:hypothetical protein
MKNAIKICFLLLFSACISDSRGQTIYGVKAGVQLAKMNGFQDQPVGFLTSLQVKGIAVMPLSDEISLLPSIGYSGKGYGWQNVNFFDQYGTPLGSGTSNGVFNYIQLSLPFSYKFTLDVEKDLYFGLGPYFAYAVSGKAKVKHVSIPNSDNSWDLFADDQYKKADAGLVVEFNSTIKKKFLVAVNVDIGLANVSNGNGNKLKQLAAGLSLGYLFAK